jgi:hypothetical protein
VKPSPATRHLVHPDSGLPVLVRFTSKPSASTLVEFEQTGLVTWRRHDGRILGATTVFLAWAPPARLGELAARADITSVEADWSPVSLPPLDITGPLSTVDLVWPQLDGLGQPLTGRGVMIADLDSGVDVFHPALLHRSDTPVAFHDDDGGDFTGAGNEWADLDGNGQRGADETLRFLEPPTTSYLPGGNPPGFDPDLDWAWIDVDNDGLLDRTPADGWTEADPSLGEPLLAARMGGGGLELYPLTQPKVLAVRETDGTVHRRGIDLTSTPSDGYAHGTPVNGILAGGWTGFTRLTGFAPEAELMVGRILYEAEPRFWRTLPAMAAWAAAEDADVLLIEDGEWVWEFMDGSSAGEQLLTELARDASLVVVTAAGNLAGGGQHDRRPAAATALAGGTTPPTFSLQVTNGGGGGGFMLWMNVNWIGTSTDLTWSLASPSTLAIGGAVPTTPQTYPTAWGSIDVLHDASPRGTQMLAFVLTASDVLPEEVFDLWLTDTTGSGRIVDAFKWDQASGWTSNNVFVGADDAGTVTWPGTADDVITVAAYSGRPGFSTPQGALNSFSGRGLGLDGRLLVDLAAPGSTTLSAGDGNAIGGTGPWSTFGGTSAALPHVAGASALLIQAEPEALHCQIREALHQGSATDADTGTVPNPDWGWGKLDASASLDSLRQIVLDWPGGDATCDGAVATDDLEALVADLWGDPQCDHADATGDSVLDAADLAAVVVLAGEGGHPCGWILLTTKGADLSPM